MDDRLEALHQALGHRFADPALLQEALTHPSAERATRAQSRNNDRLEFLGDRVLGLLVAEYLHARFPAADAGELARRYNAMVRRESLAQVAEAVGLGQHLTLSKSERASGGAAKPAILADACEAVLAALYLDGGLDAARRFVVDRFVPFMIEAAGADKDAKTMLQEFAHAQNLGQPEYAVVEQAGPPHEPVFRISVAVAGRDATIGQGRSKREAEQAAARALLAALTGPERTSDE
jgi:ribonuclease-3